MIQTLIFDLSEVLIAGLQGIEKPLSVRLNVPEESILTAFSGHWLDELFRGVISEEMYIAQVLHEQQWKIHPNEVKLIVRQNFRQRVPGMDSILNRLSVTAELILLSDHATEWITYIHSIHPFLSAFKAQFFSFELKQTKREPSTFCRVMETIGQQPEHCLFIDDNAMNIATASSVGLETIQFTSVEELSLRLSEFCL